MAEQSRERVGVYIDFDNIVISRYNQLHGKAAWGRDKVRRHLASGPESDPAVTARIRQATVDVGAILDYASSYGSIVISRAYADWSAAVNASYQRQLTDRAVDLVQLFPTVLSLKNGADIRLAVDVVEDVFRLDDLTHIVIVAGDSDYIPLAQRCKRLGRYVVGIGVSGATSSSLAAACDEFADYDALPGIAAAVTVAPEDLEESAPAEEPVTPAPGRGRGRRASRAADASAAPAERPAEPAAELAAAPPAGPPSTHLSFSAPEPEPASEPAAPRGAGAGTTPSLKAQKAATTLLLRALDLLAKNDLEWQHASAVKEQMRRLDPSFQERTFGYRQFSDFLKSREKVIELQQESPSSPILARLQP
jgi:uncharacterized LabA/DUF88 family protein